MDPVHQPGRFLVLPSECGGRKANPNPMKTIARLFLALPLVASTLLLAQPAAPGEGRPQRGPGGHGRFHPILRILDADRNGEISAGEIVHAPILLAALDLNDDGSVALDELRPPRPADAPARPAPPAGTARVRPIDPVMLALDANGDGALNAAEIANAAASLAALDANQDGRLTRDELRPLPPTQE